MFESWFVNNGSTDSENVCDFGNWFKIFISFYVAYFTFLLLDPENGAQVELLSSTRYVDGWLRFPRCTCMHYINDWCRIVVSVNSPMQINVWSYMYVFGTSDSKYYRRQSLWDKWRCISHCPTIGGLSFSSIISFASGLTLVLSTDKGKNWIVF